MGRFAGVALLVLIPIMLLGTAPARADAPAAGSGQQDTGTLAERLVSLPIEGLTRALDLLGLVDIQQLVFSQDQPLSGPVLALVVRWYTELMVVCFFLLAIVFAWHAALLGRAASPAQRAEAKSGFGRWTLALGAACLALALVKLLLALNSALVAFAAAHATNFSVDAVTSTGSVLATAVINLLLAGLKLYFNVLYTIRLVFIVVLLAIAPLVIWSLALRSSRGGFPLWAAELFANIMMQASHALVLAALVSLLDAGTTHTLLDHWFAKIVVITLILPLGRFLRNLVSSWLYIAGSAEEHASSLLGGMSRSFTNLGRMVGWGGPGGGSPFPSPGGEEGNDYNIGGSGPGGSPGGGPAGSAPGPVTSGGGSAPILSPLRPSGFATPGGSGSWAGGGARMPGGGSGGGVGSGPGGLSLPRGIPQGDGPQPGYLPAPAGEGDGGGYLPTPSVGGGPGPGDSTSSGAGGGDAPASASGGYAGAGETFGAHAGPEWPPSLDQLPDWRGLGEGGELPLELFP